MKVINSVLCALIITANIVACGGDGSSKRLPAAPVVTVDADIKQLIFRWAAVPKATHYRLTENLDGHSGFTQTGDDIPAGTLSTTKHIAVHLHDWIDALYMLQACNAAGCTSSIEVSTSDLMLNTIATLRATNSEIDDYFGLAIALSSDGHTLAVGAPGEDSAASGVNGNQLDNSASGSGAVWVFRSSGEDWVEQAYVKASNPDGFRCTIPDPDCREFGDHEPGDDFGEAIALSANGNTLVVGVSGEDSNAAGINGDQNNNLAIDAGAVYVFRRDGTNWSQQAYIKPSSAAAGQRFGDAVAVSADGDTFATGAPGDKVIYVFQFDGDRWVEKAGIRTTIIRAGIGSSIDLSADGNALAVGAPINSSNATGINGDPDNMELVNSGAAIAYRFNGMDWLEDAFFKASNTGEQDLFGRAVALSADGNTMAVGAWGEDSNASGINGDQSNNAAFDSGAVYLFRFDGAEWSQQAYVKASNTQVEDFFGDPILVLSSDGNTLVVGAQGEDSCAVGINGDQSDDSCWAAGAVYLFRFDGTDWSQHSYIKAPTGGARIFWAAGLSADADKLIVNSEDGVYLY